MRVLFVIPHPIEGPSSRFRVYQYAPFLRAHGVDVVVRPFVPSSLLRIAFEPGHVPTKALGLGWASFRRCLDLARARRFDVVFIHREAFPFGPPVFEALFKRLGRRMVFDFDDSIFLRSRIFANVWDRWKDVRKPLRMLRMADLVVVGNDYLARQARRLARRVAVLPTVVDTEHYQSRRPHAGDGPPVVGWIGTPSSRTYLESLVPAFQRVSKETRVRFHFVGVAPFACDGIAAHFTPWSLASERADLAGFDIGVMPLFDDAEARGKCGLKLLQYMAVGVASVASPFGVNPEIITHGTNGLLAATETEWVEGLTSLVEDAGLRDELGAAGRRTVENRYSVRVMGPRLLDALHQVASGA